MLPYAGKAGSKGAVTVVMRAVAYRPEGTCLEWRGRHCGQAHLLQCCWYRTWHVWCMVD